MSNCVDCVDYIGNLDLGEFPSIACFGSQQTGKTYLIRKFLEHFGSYYTAIVVTRPSYGHSPLHLNDPRFISIPNQDSSVEEVVSQCIEQRRIENELPPAEYARREREGTLASTLLILDDFMSGLDFKTSKNFRNPDGTKGNVYKTIGTCSRHLRLTVIWLAQTFTSSMPPVIRSNTKYYFLFDGMVMSNCEAIYGSLPSGFANKYEWVNFYKKHTKKKYSFIFIDKTGNYRDKNIIPCKKINNEFAIIEDKPRTRNKPKAPSIPIRAPAKPFPPKNKPSKSSSSSSSRRQSSSSGTWLEEARARVFGSYC